MIRWPEKFKWIEGKSSKIKYLQGAVRTMASLAENLFIRINRLPSRPLYQGKERRKKIVVSLTSYPGRIDSVYYAIKSLMLQTMKPDRIVLWLSEEQFPDKSLPDNLKKLITRGLEIKFTEDDLRSHKKYFYMLQEQKEDELVITFDDDLIYEANAVKRLYSKHIESPESIICNRGVTLQYDTENGIRRMPSGSLYTDKGVEAPSHIVVPSTGAGCLYPYGIMPLSTFDKGEILKKAITADDLWIWYNALKGGVKVFKTQKISRVLCEVINSQKSRLSDINDIGCENDRVLERFDFSKIPLKGYLSNTK